ncbi:MULTISPECIES: hypothetical protein [Methylomonas]|uniref:hypothetical protein n=1 Tax=Methylomonas TaxID=416 RepID=UPI0007C9829B|nr:MULTISPECIES: hypothetical protein [Methylomonas]ANE54231.1 hypothetical protein AYM39_02855 [Methylomonas sp. DH-1]
MSLAPVFLCRFQRGKRPVPATHPHQAGEQEPDFGLRAILKTVFGFDRFAARISSASKAMLLHNTHSPASGKNCSSSGGISSPQREQKVSGFEIGFIISLLVVVLDEDKRNLSYLLSILRHF